MRYGVILAGGGGTRLWPASRRGRPKQFLPLGAGGESLLAATARRLRPVCGTSNLVVVTASEQTEAVRDALPGVADECIIGEPVGRNTAAAIGLAAIHLCERDPDAVLGVLPSDHHVSDEAEFAATLDRAFCAAEVGDRIVTIGLVPTRAETGFGYLELGDDEVEPGVRPVARFVEKPDFPTAESYVSGGRHLWNGGMFFARAARLLADLERFLPELRAGLEEIARALDDGPAAAERTAARLYPALPSISIDHGVLERADNVVCVPGHFGWSDVGSWSALSELHTPDQAGNVDLGDSILRDAFGNIVSADANVVVALVGVSDLVVVQSGDAILVVPKARAQEVKEVVATLRERGLDRHL